MGLGEAKAHSKPAAVAAAHALWQHCMCSALKAVLGATPEEQPARRRDEANKDHIACDGGREVPQKLQVAGIAYCSSAMQAWSACDGPYQ